MDHSLRMVRVGQIINTQGVKGEVRIWPLTSNKERMNQLKRVYLEDPNQNFRSNPNEVLNIEQVRPHKELYVIKFKEVDSMTEAEKLKGRYMLIPASEVPPAEPDVFYHFQLLGLEVWEETGEHLGYLNDILETGANDVYVVKKPSEDGKGQEVLIPALKSVIREVNLEQGKMVVALPEGLR